MVCVLPGTELSFASEVSCGLLAWRARVIKQAASVRSFLASVVRKKLTPLISKMFDGGGRPPFGSNPRAGVFRIMLLLNELRLRLG